MVSGGVSANQRLRAALHRRGRPAGRARVLSAHRVLHRQRGDDRGGGPGAAAGRGARRPCDPAARPVAARDADAVPLQHQAVVETALPQTHDPLHSIRRPYLPARPDGRVHHRLHRLGAARQADRRDRPRAARGLSPRRGQRRCRRHGGLQEGRQARAGVHRGLRVQAGRDAGAPPGAAAARGVRAGVGAHLAQQAGRHPQFARCGCGRSSAAARI